jgi:hypothetical protein
MSTPSDERTAHIIRAFGLSDIVPRASDFATARAHLLPTDGSTPIFAGGKPIMRRRESSSPAVEEALARGFALAHFPARALLPEDSFARFGSRRKSASAAAARVGRSPDPSAPAPSASRGRSAASVAAASSAQQGGPAAAAGDELDSARIPRGISPHVLPRNALMRPLPPARELLETHVPLQRTDRYDASNERWLTGVDAGDFAVSDPVVVAELAKAYRRCFPRTERDDQLEELPTSRFCGNFLLRRWGGAFPPHCHYDFYRRYGEFGIGAASAEYHNFPAGRHPLGPI